MTADAVRAFVQGNLVAPAEKPRRRQSGYAGSDDGDLQAGGHGHAANTGVEQRDLPRAAMGQGFCSPKRPDCLVGSPMTDPKAAHRRSMGHDTCGHSRYEGRPGKDLFAGDAHCTVPFSRALGTFSDAQ